MKKIKVSLILMVTLTFLLILAGCGGNSETTQTPPPTEEKSEAVMASGGDLADGIYFAQDEQFAENGWKYMVILKVSGGKIVEATWNGANRDGGYDKIYRSSNGMYPMVERGGAQAEWHEQAAKAEAYLLETQDPTAISYTDDEGHTDAISGVSIHVVEFFELAEKALKDGPSSRGPYTDGTYHAEDADFAENGWKYMVDLTVINGNIVAANWNGIHKDGGDDKKTRASAGEYGMKEKGGAQANWTEQARAAEAYLLDKQDPKAISYTDDEGHTDAISGVSIHVVEFFSLAEEALKSAM